MLPLRSLWNVRQAKSQLAVFAQLPVHTAIVPFVDIDSAGGYHYLVWPFVEGITLAARVEEKGPASPAIAAMVMAEIAEGLAICHAGGIAHGLFTPSNVLIGTDGHVRILDLGVGALLSENLADDESMLDTMSAAHATMGMFECCAPETLNSPTLRDPAGDIYSFGCVFYYVLTGQMPFPDGNVVDKILAHQTVPAPSVRTLRPNVPVWLDELIQKLMSKRPEQRPASMAEVHALLVERAGDLSREPQPVAVQAPIPVATQPAPQPIPQGLTITPLPMHPLSGHSESGIDTPHQWSSRFMTVSQRLQNSPLSASEIDFSDYDAPDETSEHDWTSSRHPSPATPPVIEEEPVLLSRLQAPPKSLAVPIVLNAPDPITLELQSERSEPSIADLKLSSKLPSPVNYAPTHQPVQAVFTPEPPPLPKFARTWWHRFKSLFNRISPVVSDVLQLSIFGPDRVAPGQSFKLQVFSHLPDSFESVCTLARAFHSDSALLKTEYLDKPVQRNLEMELFLQITNAGVARSLMKLTWLGQPQPRAFDVHVPWESPAGLTPVSLTVGVNGEVRGEICFELNILPRRG